MEKGEKDGQGLDAEAGTSGEQQQLVLNNDEELNQALEEFARSYSLTAQNVKNIIFHIVKNPHTFATLVRRDPDAIAGIRMTRSRLRQLERIARRRIPLSARLRPIVGPKTFLDVNYDEEEDADYSPCRDATSTKYSKGDNARWDDGDEEEGNDSSSDSSNSTDDEEKNDDEEEDEGERKVEDPSDTGMDGQLMIVEDGEQSEGERRVNKGNEEAEEENTAQSAEFLTEVDNPIYPLFIKSVIAGEPSELCPELYDEDNDPEYVFHEFDEFCEQEDEYEFRRDRATEIPRWEVKALEQDFEDEEQPTPLNVPIADEQETEQKCFAHLQSTTSSMGQKQWISRKEQRRQQQEAISSNAPTSSNATKVTAGTQTGIDEVDVEEAVEAEEQQPSCSLLATPVRFKRAELGALKVQLEKHVQLLCQAIVGTSQEPELMEPRNRSMLMLRELDELGREKGEHSMFNVPIMEAAIYSAHDIQACREVELALNQDHNNRPSNEVMWVLSRSEAIRYPELLCVNRFVIHPQMQPRFLPSEQLLLAMGLYQLGAVPHRHPKQCGRGRYQLIHEYFLPNKRVNQIRNHLKNVHSCPSPGLLHHIIMEAEKGSLPVTYRPDLGEKAQRGTPITWPEKLQPYWLKWLSEVLRDGQTQMIMMDNQQAEVDRERRSVKAELVEEAALEPGMVEEAHPESDLLVPRIAKVEAIEDPEPETTRNPIDQQQVEPGESKFRILLPTRIEQQSPNQHPSTSSTSAVTRKPELRPRPRILTTRKRLPTNKIEDQQTEHTNQQKRRRTKMISSPTLPQEDYGTTTCMAMGNTTSGPDENSNEAHQQQREEVGVVQHRDDNNKNVNGTTETNNGTPLQKKSRRRERAERGLAALNDRVAREQTSRALVEAIYEDCKKRMFMHQDKLRAVQCALARQDQSTRACFDALWECMGDSHPQLFHLFAACAPDTELPHSLRMDPHRVACKRALRMLQTIHTYLSASRSAVHMKSALKFLKEANKQICSESQLFEALQQHFGVRDEPLWRLLRREWMEAKFEEKVEDWQFEWVDMDKMQQEQHQQQQQDQHLYESVRIPYRRDPTERSRLRVRHGRVTVEMNGRLRNVSIGCAPPSTDELASTTGKDPSTALVAEQPSATTANSSETAKAQSKKICWTKAMDAALLHAWNRADGDKYKCVDSFLQCIDRNKWKGTLVFSVEEVGRRLDVLLAVASQLKRNKQNTEK